MDPKFQHLGFIQATIIRMAANSFLLKGWAVTIVAAILAVSATTGNHHLAALGFLPSLTFWVLDSYYLRQERLFRKLYDRVRVISSDKEVDYSMDTSPVKTQVPTWIATVISVTEAIFYVPIVVVVALISSLR